MAAHRTVSQAGEVNHSWVQGFGRNRGTSPVMGITPGEQVR